MYIIIDNTLSLRIVYAKIKKFILLYSNSTKIMVYDIKIAFCFYVCMV